MNQTETQTDNNFQFLQQLPSENQVIEEAGLVNQKQDLQSSQIQQMQEHSESAESAEESIQEMYEDEQFEQSDVRQKISPEQQSRQEEKISEKNVGLQKGQESLQEKQQIIQNSYSLQHSQSDITNSQKQSNEEIQPSKMHQQTVEIQSKEQQHQNINAQALKQLQTSPASEEINEDQLHNQIQQMQLKLQQMTTLIKQKQTLLRSEQWLNEDQSINQPQGQSQEQKHPKVKKIKNSSKIFLTSLHKNNEKTQKIYLSQLQSLQKKSKQLQQKEIEYQTKKLQNSLKLIRTQNTSQSSTNEPKQLVEMIEEEILLIKETILQTQKANFYQKKAIKNTESLIEKQQSNSYHSFQKTHVKDSSKNLTQLAEGLILKRKLQEKLSQKLQKLQIQLNASFIKNQQTNDSLKSLIKQFPEFEDQRQINLQNQSCLRTTSRQLTLQKWSAKSSEAIINKNLFQMLRKRKQKAIKANDLQRKQLQHQERQLQRDIKGLRKILEEKEQSISEVEQKNGIIEGKIGEQEANRNKILVFREEKIKSSQHQKKQYGLMDAQEESEISLQVQKAQQQKHLLQFISTQSKQQQQKDLQPDVSLICSVSLEPEKNQLHQSKASLQDKQETIVQQSQNLNDHTDSPPVKKKEQEQGNNFRITRPKFPKLFKRQRSINDDRYNKIHADISQEQTDSTPRTQLNSIKIEAFPSPRLLKPSFSTPKSRRNSQQSRKSFVRPKSKSFLHGVESVQENLSTFNDNSQNKIPQGQNKIHHKQSLPQTQEEKPIFSPNSQHSIQNQSHHRSQKKDSNVGLNDRKKQQQMMNVLRQSIIRVTSQSKQKKLKQQQSNKQQQTDTHKTLRNLINQNLYMIKNQSFIEEDTQKSKKEMNDSKKDLKNGKKNLFSPFSKEKFLKEEKDSESIILLNKGHDEIRTQKKRRRSYMLAAQQSSTSISPGDQPSYQNKSYSQSVQKKSPTKNDHLSKINEQPSSIHKQMEKVKSQIEQTILKIQSIEDKIGRESVMNTSKGIRSGFQRGRIIREKSQLFDDLGEE